MDADGESMDVMKCLFLSEEICTLSDLHKGLKIFSVGAYSCDTWSVAVCK